MSPTSRRGDRETQGGAAVNRPGWKAWAAPVAAAIVLLLAALFVPAPEPRPAPTAGAKPFAWNQDERWEELENSFREARAAGCEAVADRLARGLAEADGLLAQAASQELLPGDPLLDALEKRIFEAGPLVGACPSRLPDYRELVNGARNVLKARSRAWGANDPESRARLYRLLYGGRAALEEVMLQAPEGAYPSLVHGEDEPSAAPGTDVLGVRIRSGDILISRGGAPTSALIARGNDYPGNFSHTALAHVDEKTGRVSIIEAHIERGVAVASLEDYLRDTKLRIMVLRLRSDLPAVKADPLLPHRAAARALGEARRRHIPYDFAMDTADPGKLYCSEVVSAAYRREGVVLWKDLSRISSTGVASWLSAFGVRHFETLAPADLEYDPQIAVVAEWRDPEALLGDHVDNAVVEAMLEGAERGDRLGYRWYLLPVARAVKLYSLILNRLGKVGPVPEGMSAESSLRHRSLAARHAGAKKILLRMAADFKRREGYVPPYWELLEMARHALAEAGAGA